MTGVDPQGAMSKPDGQRKSNGAPESLAPSADSTLSLQGKWKSWEARATGMYAGAALAALGIGSALLWANPQTDPRHFILTILAAVVAGAFFAVGMCHGRLQDALRAQEAFRYEMNRIAERNHELERLILKNRLSSADPSSLAEPNPGTAKPAKPNPKRSKQ